MGIGGGHKSLTQYNIPMVVSWRILPGNTAKFLQIVTPFTLQGCSAALPTIQVHWCVLVIIIFKFVFTLIVLLASKLTMTHALLCE